MVARAIQRVSLFSLRNYSLLVSKQAELSSLKNKVVSLSELEPITKSQDGFAQCKQNIKTCLNGEEKSKTATLFKSPPCVS